MKNSVLSIAGSDSGGGAGIQADIKTISALGCFATTAITALTAQNTLGVQAVYDIKANFVSRQIQSVLSDIKTDAIKIGMLHSSEIIHSVAKSILPYRHLPIILDPVMVATSGDLLIYPEAVQSLIKNIFPLCELLTPNVNEAQILSQHKIHNIEDMKCAAQIMANLGAKNVLVKGGDQEGPTAIDILYLSHTQEFFILEEEMIQTQNTHGTGCSLSSAIAAYRAQGKDLISSVQTAKKYIHEAIKQAQHFKLGQGKGPIHHFWRHT